MAEEHKDGEEPPASPTEGVSTSIQVAQSTNSSKTKASSTTAGSSVTTSKKKRGRPAKRSIESLPMESAAHQDQEAPTASGQSERSQASVATKTAHDPRSRGSNKEPTSIESAVNDVEASAKPDNGLDIFSRVIDHTIPSSQTSPNTATALPSSNLPVAPYNPYQQLTHGLAHFAPSPQPYRSPYQQNNNHTYHSDSPSTPQNNALGTALLPNGTSPNVALRPLSIDSGAYAQAAAEPSKYSINQPSMPHSPSRYQHLAPRVPDSHHGRPIIPAPTTQNLVVPNVIPPPMPLPQSQHSLNPGGSTKQNLMNGDKTEVLPAAAKKRGRPRKIPLEDDVTLGHVSNSIIKPKRPYKRKVVEGRELQSTENSQEIDGTPVRKKRAYNKKKKIEGPTNTPNVPLAGGDRHPGVMPIAAQGELQSLHPVLPEVSNSGMSQSFSLRDANSPVPASNDHLPDPVIGNRPDQFNTSASYTPRASFSGNGTIGTDYGDGREPATALSYPIGRTPFGVEGEDDEDGSSGDEEGFEDNVVYSNIMSQVTKYTGETTNKRGRKARQHLEDFLGFTETAEEEQDLEELQTATEKDVVKKKVVRRRGPRVAAEPTGEIKMRLGLANEAFQESNIEEARRLADEIIRINAETYEAWNLLSSIFEEQGLREDALMALIVAAHLRPKHVEAWFNAADYALTSMGPITPNLLRDVDFCLSSAVRLIPSNIEARIRKAQVLVMREHFNKAAADYRYILRTLPNNLDLIRELGAVYVDLADGNAGVELFQNTFARFKESPDDFDQSMDWNDLHSLAVLYSFLDKHQEALTELKRHARWLLGREDETYWDEVVDNDSEWDDDDSRRSSIAQFSYGRYPLMSYGEGLPIELRIYLGRFRLMLDNFEEAMKHFNYLLANNPETSQPFTQSYPDVALGVAEGLFEKKKFKDALPFYNAVKQVPGQNSAELCIQIGKCLVREDDSKGAEQVLREACLLDQSNIEARVELARMYENMDEADQAHVYVNQILQLQSANRPKVTRQRLDPVNNRSQPTLAPAPPPYQQKSIVPLTKDAGAKLRKAKKADEKVLDREVQAMQLRECYLILKESTDRMRSGSQSATDSWMDAARGLTEDFRSCVAFYPWDRREFGGYSAEEQKTAQMNLNMDVKALAEHREQNIGSEDREASSSGVPNHYRGITFREWVEIFCEYALCLAKRGRGREAYDICEAATHAICFCFSKPDMFTIHLTYAVCALISNDEETCVAIARWFMTQYQFATDSYRMFAALMRMCHTPISWYTSGPTQKFILRQIKTVDYAISNPVRQRLIHKDKASYTHLDQNGQSIINKELDVHLLMIYGHILIAGASYLYALNYFHRALTQDPDNPMILLALGLSYSQYALKRQIENRQHTLMQGFAFLQRYYDIRSQSQHFVERQEAHYNMARAYHLVGLTNLAIPYYMKVLKGESKRRDELGGCSEQGIGRQDEDEDGVVEDMCVETAYNLQVIYTVAGNYKLAEKVTKKWLVI